MIGFINLIPGTIMTLPPPKFSISKLIVVLTPTSRHKNTQVCHFDKFGIDYQRFTRYPLHPPSWASQDISKGS